MGMKARPTNYKGHNMRSRLEARWAVFMDVCGIGWEYEPTHLIIEFSDGRDRMDWLPDFRLENGWWAEAKGALPGGEFFRLMELSYQVGLTGQDVVILGHMPDALSDCWPVQLHVEGEDMWAGPWRWPPNRRAKHGRYVHHSDIDAELLLKGLPGCQPDWAEPGLSYARQARFPWG